MYTHKDQRKAAYFINHHLRRKRLGLREGRFAGGKNLKQYWDDKRHKTGDFNFLMRIDEGIFWDLPSSDYVNGKLWPWP